MRSYGSFGTYSKVTEAKRTAAARQARQSFFLLVFGLSVVVGCSGGGEKNRTSSLGPLSPMARLAERRVSTKITNGQTLNVQLALARTLETKVETEQAIAAYRNISKRFPHDPTAVHRLAILYDQQGRFGESKKLFRKALRLQPGNPDIFCDLGYSLYCQQRWREAERNLQQAIELEDDHARAHNHLGLLLSQLDRREEALAEFRKAGRSKAEAHMNVAFVLTMRDQLMEARQEYDVAREYDPDSPELLVRVRTLDALIAGLQPPDWAVVDANPVGRDFIRLVNHFRQSDASNLHPACTRSRNGAD
jgi:Flp pilus assembly protein TadD